MLELDRLLLVAAANLTLAVAMAIPLAGRYLGAAYRAVVAVVAGLGVVVMVAAFLYFRATMPPAFVMSHEGFSLGALDHGDFVAQQWDMRLSMTVALALYLTAATVVLFALWRVSACRALRRRGVSR